jgi:hypothetical protein
MARRQHDKLLAPALKNGDEQTINGPVHGVSARSACDVLAGLMKEAASMGGLNTPTLPTNYLPRAKLSFCMTCAITEKPRAITIVTVQKGSHMGLAPLAG